MKTHDQYKFDTAVAWIRENGLINWNWTSGQVSSEAIADGLKEHVDHPSFWMGVFHGIREYNKELENGA